MARVFRWMANARTAASSASPPPASPRWRPLANWWSCDFPGLNDSAKPKVPAGIQMTPDEIANDTLGGEGARFIRIPQRLLNPVVQNFIADYFPKISTGYPINPKNGRLTEFFTNEP